MLLLPGYAIATFAIYLFSLMSLSFFNLNDYFYLFGLIYKIPAFEKLIFLTISIGITFYLYEKTRWGELTKKTFSFGCNNYFD